MDQRALTRGEAKCNVGLPVYLSIAREIERDIGDDVWPHGTSLPSEKILAERFAASVGTVRKAVAELVDRGLVVRRQGIGTFVLTQPPAPRLEPSTPFALNQASEPDSANPPGKLIGLIESHANVEQARALGVAEGTPVWLIKSTYDFNGQAIAYEINTIAKQDYPELSIDMLNRFNGSIYRVAAEVYFRETRKSTDQVSIKSPYAEVRSAFGMGTGDSCLRVHRLTVDNSDKTIESREVWLDPVLVHYRASSDLA